MTTRASSFRAAGVALGALLRRDLSAGRRGATVASARLVVVAASGCVAVAALLNARDLYGQPHVAGIVGWSLAWILAAFSLLLLPVLSLQVMRQDRESGTLELLLLAGLSPRLLAFGRWLSTFLLLESLVLDSLPGLAVFAFFGSPTPAELGWGLLALTGWNASLAGFAVYLSSAIRRTGPCLTTSIFLVLLLTAATSWGVATASDGGDFSVVPAASPLLLAELTFRRLNAARLPDLEPLRHLSGLACAIGIGALLALLAGERLTVQGRPAAAKTARSPRLQALSSFGRPGRLRGWPLTWLLQRGAPATRPLALALALPFPLIAVAIGFEVFLRQDHSSLGWQDVLDPSVLTTFAVGYWGFGLLLVLITSALQVARARERKEWESLLATCRSGRAIVLDLLAGPGAAAGVVLSLACALFLTAAIVGPQAFEAQALRYGVTASVAVAGTGLLMLALGFVSGLAARSQAGALGLSLLLLIAAAAVGIVSAAILDSTLLGLGLELQSRVSTVALTASLVLPLQLWLLERSRQRPGAGRLFFELLLCACLISPPLVQGLFSTSDDTEAFLMTALASAALGLPLLAVTLRRPDFWLGRTG